MNIRGKLKLPLINCFAAIFKDTPNGCSFMTSPLRELNVKHVFKLDPSTNELKGNK